MDRRQAVGGGEKIAIECLFGVNTLIVVVCHTFDNYHVRFDRFPAYLADKRRISSAFERFYPAIKVYQFGHKLFITSRKLRRNALFTPLWLAV